MLKKILIGFLLATVIILALVWLATGGFRRISDSARNLGGSLSGMFWNSTSTGTFALPWQPENLNIGPDLAALYGAEEAMDAGTPEEELARSQKEYDELLKQTSAADRFGEPSPHRGKVSLSQGNAAESGIAEYLEMEAAYGNTAPISLAGWSVQSALTGIRVPIPRGSELFILGDLNAQGDILLNPGARAILSSRASPVGTSFRENRCTGYLATMQGLTPSLSRSCPPPSESLPLTPENLRTYGDACYDFVQTLPPCTFPLSVPGDITPACRIFLSNNLSYNGCVQQYRYRSNFTGNAWRIFLGTNRELWRNSHDIIRLLDENGKTVDAVSY